MLTIDSMPNPLRTLTGKGSLLFLTRFVRLFAYGSLSVVLVFYLIGLGLSESQTGLLLTLTLVGDTVVSLKKAGVADSAVAYIGDDLPDIPLMLRAGLAAVGDAVLEVKNAAHYTTRAHAGHGAIREAVELVLKSKGVWEAMIDKARA